MAEKEQLFKKGDTVKLKSGGPKMTIEVDKIGVDMGGGSKFFTGNYECTWFEGSVLKRSQFAQESLIAD